MKISVKAKTRAKEEKVEQLTQPTLGFAGEAPETLIYRVSVKEPPVDGKANEAIARVLARHFDTSLSQVRLLSGHTSKQKVFEIL
jgi:uncharacterized protein YggU (UPF0235/DUF167 family)